MKTLQNLWMEFTASLGMNPTQGRIAWKELNAQYNKPKRFYHTLDGHIGHCIRMFRAIRQEAKNPLALEAAL